MQVNSSRVEFEDSVTTASDLDESGDMRPLLEFVAWGGMELAFPLAGVPFGTGIWGDTRMSASKVVAGRSTPSAEATAPCLSVVSAKALRRKRYLRMAGDKLDKCSVTCQVRKDGE